VVDGGRERSLDHLEVRGAEETRGADPGREEDAGEAAERVAVARRGFPRQAAVVARHQAAGGGGS